MEEDFEELVVTIEEEMVSDCMSAIACERGAKQERIYLLLRICPFAVASAAS